LGDSRLATFGAIAREVSVSTAFEAFAILGPLLSAVPGLCYVSLVLLRLVAPLSSLSLTSSSKASLVSLLGKVARGDRFWLRSMGRGVLFNARGAFDELYCPGRGHWFRSWLSRAFWKGFCLPCDWWPSSVLRLIWFSTWAA